MTTARDIMERGAQCVRTDQTAADAARMMAELGVGRSPPAARTRRLEGAITDRDLVIKGIGQGREAGTFPAGDLNQSEAIIIGADDPIEEVLATMTRHQIRRLPIFTRTNSSGWWPSPMLPEPEVGRLAEAPSAE